MMVSSGGSAFGANFGCRSATTSSSARKRLRPSMPPSLLTAASIWPRFNLLYLIFMTSPFRLLAGCSPLPEGLRFTEYDFDGQFNAHRNVAAAALARMLFIETRCRSGYAA